LFWHGYETVDRCILRQLATRDHGGMPRAQARDGEAERPVRGACQVSQERSARATPEGQQPDDPSLSGLSRESGSEMQIGARRDGAPVELHRPRRMWVTSMSNRSNRSSASPTCCPDQNTSSLTINDHLRRNMLNGPGLVNRAIWLYP